MIRERLASMPFSQWWESIRTGYENLSDRERRLVVAMGVLLSATLTLVPLYLMFASMGEMRDENEEIRALLRELNRNQSSLRELRAKRQAAEQRYNNKTPSLGSFVEEKASGQGITLREVSDEPDQQLAGFSRREVSVSIPEVGLAPLIRLLADIDNSPHAVGISRANIEHFQDGDQYSAKLSIAAYDRISAPAAIDSQESTDEP